MKISEVEFGSLLTYSPHGSSKKAEESKAVMRTMSNPEEFSEIVDPCVGKIRLSGENSWRDP